jgi:hypothetical protein
MTGRMGEPNGTPVLTICRWRSDRMILSHAGLDGSTRRVVKVRVVATAQGMIVCQRLQNTDVVRDAVLDSGNRRGGGLLKE